MFEVLKYEQDKKIFIFKKWFALIMITLLSKYIFAYNKSKFFMDLSLILFKNKKINRY